MGKKRIVTKVGQSVDQGLKSRALARLAKRKIDHGILNIRATYNNTLVTLADSNGNAVMASSSGALGFRGAKKSTPFAAAKVGELIGEKAVMIGVSAVSVVVSGIGSGRESALRAFAGKGIAISNIHDRTPVPFNGPRQKKPRRV
jgi:small subunit ribosomal protein S11